MTAGYTKLFGGDLLQSSVWQEDLHVKVVWITMLSLTDGKGVVAASVPGLARTAGVTLSQCEESLAKFLAPDKYSRTKAHEGRRIEEVDGGWRLLNHAAYRVKLNAAEQREKAAARMRRLREEARTTANEGEQPRTDANEAEQTELSPHPVRDVRDHRSQITDPPSLIGDRSGLPEDPEPASPEPPDPGAIVRAEREDLGPPFEPADEPPPDLEIGLSESWTPAPESALDAEAIALGVDLAAELVKLRDRARARGKTSCDWQATWREWVRRAIEHARKHRTAPSAPVRRQDPVADDRITRLRAANARENAERAAADARAAADRDAVIAERDAVLKNGFRPSPDEKAPE